MDATAPSFADSLLDAMSDLVSEIIGESVTVTSYKEQDYTTGFCESCYFEGSEVVFRFTYDHTGGTGEYAWAGSYGDLIRELTS